MECSLCYEKFLIPKTNEEKEDLELYIEENPEEIMKIDNLLITPKHNKTHTCSICDCIICRDCWFKYTFDYKIDHDILNKCPFCIQIDWKDHMGNVLYELQMKVLGWEKVAEEFNCDEIICLGDSVEFVKKYFKDKLI